MEGVDHGRMVAAELLADAGERVASDLATEIHRNLPAKRDARVRFFDLRSAKRMWNLSETTC